MSANYNQLTKKEFERLGWIGDNVEGFNAYTQRKKDMFGVFDFICLDGQPGVLAVQVTSRGNISSRRKKIAASGIVEPWVAAGNRIEIWGWDQPGGPRTRWRLQREVISCGQ